MREAVQELFWAGVMMVYTLIVWHLGNNNVTLTDILVWLAK